MTASFLLELKTAAEAAKTAEASFRREATLRVAALEQERAFAFRRLDLMQAIAEAMVSAESEEIAVASAFAALRTRLGWNSDSEARSEVIMHFSPVALAVFRASGEDESADATRPSRPSNVGTLKPEDRHSGSCLSTRCQTRLSSIFKERRPFQAWKLRTYIEGRNRTGCRRSCRSMERQQRVRACPRAAPKEGLRVGGKPKFKPSHYRRSQCFLVAAKRHFHGVSSLIAERRMTTTLLGDRRLAVALIGAILAPNAEQEKLRLLLSA